MTMKAVLAVNEQEKMVKLTALLKNTIQPLSSVSILFFVFFETIHINRLAWYICTFYTY